MPTAIVMLKIDHRRVTGTAEKLLEIQSITDVYSVSGRFDLLVIIKCDSIDMIESVITDELLKTEGILESETMFAFRSYDKREGGRAVDAQRVQRALADGEDGFLDGFA
jgi:DNA-binding Lrp family transcriptional regulator